MSSMLGIPDLGYLFDNVFMVESLLFSSPAHPKPQGPHLSVPAKSRQTCLVFAQVSHRNQQRGREMHQKEDLQDKHT